MRDFNEWLSEFKPSIANFGYYIDFNKVFRNIETIKIELNILNSLIGSKNIEQDFVKLITEYPKTIKCIPLLLAVRGYEIYVLYNDKSKIFDFKKCDNISDCVLFMKESGLFNLISNHIVNNLVDYATGVEVGLDSNGRKNRSGHLMEDAVENYLKKFQGLEYYKEMYLADIEKKWYIDLSAISNKGKARKRFDFVVKTNSMIYAIETNFYGGTSGGSKLNETARSYKMIAHEAKDIQGFKFVWITDGTAWRSARGNIEETFDILEDIYNLTELENGILNKVLI